MRRVIAMENHLENRPCSLLRHPVVEILRERVVRDCEPDQRPVVSGLEKGLRLRLNKSKQEPSASNNQ